MLISYHTALKFQTQNYILLFNNYSYHRNYPCDLDRDCKDRPDLMLIGTFPYQNC
jgi:hypothetical protein